MFDKRLFQLVPGAVKFIVGSVTLMVVALLANIIMMVALGVALQDIFTGEQVLLANGALCIVAFAIVVRAVCTYAAQNLGNEASITAMETIRQTVYRKLVALGPSYAESVSTSEAVQMTIDGSSQLEVYFGSFMPQLFYSVIAPIVLFLCLVAIAPVPSIVLLVCVPLIPALIMLVRRKAGAAAEAYWASYVDLGSVFLEDIQGLTTLKIFRADKMRHEKMNHQAESFRQATMRMLRVQLKSIGAMDIVAYAGAAIGAVVALVQFASGQLPFSAVFSIVFLSQEFFLPMRALGSLFHASMNGVAASKRMFELLDIEEPKRGSVEPDRSTCELRCENVCYEYPGAEGKQALVNVNVMFPAGSFTGIVGKSGAGKSTLATVISGASSRYQGHVTVNGAEMTDISRDSLRNLITVVPSDGLLFTGTVRQNLRMGNPNADETMMREALGRCGMLEFIDDAGGLDTQVEEAGANFSGGQRQRICLARALLHDTPAYLFDEATSSIDVESERAISKVIESMAAEKRTVIVIAHRLSLVANADSIVVVDAGRIEEQGTRAELLQKGGVFADLWQSQAHLEEVALQAERAEAAQASVDVNGKGRTRVATANAPAAMPVQPKPGPGAAKRRSSLSIMARMIKLVGPLAPYMALAIVLGVFGFLAAIFLTVFASMGIVDAALASGAAVAGFCAASIVCGVVRGPLRYTEQLCNHYIAFSILARIRDVLYGALRRLAPAKLEGRRKGDLVSVATSDIELLEVFYAHTISPIAIATVVSIVMLVFFGFNAPAMVPWALAAYLIIGVAMPVIASKSTGDAGLAQRNGQGAVQSFTLESLRGLRELLQFGQAENRSHELASQTHELGKIELTLKVRSSVFEAVAQALIAAMSVGMLQYLLSLTAAGSLSLGAAFVASFAFMSSFGPVVAVMRLGTTLQQTLASGQRVLDLLDEEPETRDVENGADIEFAGARAHDVSFAYAGMREQVLSHVSFDLPKGTVTALTGENGAGKSTTLKLLMRFWDVDEGGIELSGADVRKVNTESLRANEGYMTQDTHLFVGTIGENLRIAKQDATDEELREACRRASLLELIDSLPKGFDTLAGELGGRLSGGERQRIGLARIFLQDAPFLLLDEPTSNIDALNEAAILESLSQAKAGKTVVMVSHRASTRALADRTVSLDR